jgi:NAD(P)-dependent dehydrogenase (short-subunit alcohol dehydrogenase family)
MRLQGKHALITAAASGIGRAAAVLFAREGAAVAVADIDRGRITDTVAEITKAGGRAHGIPCDLTKEADAKRIVRDAIAALGGLDILWNNVGHPGPGRVEGVDLDDVDLALTLNLRSVLITTAEAIPALRTRGGGSILFTSSIAGIYGSRRSARSTRRQSSASPGSPSRCPSASPPTASGSTVSARLRSTRRCSTSSWVDPTWSPTSTRTWRA